ncbi:hypothetical protein SBA4_3340005 [Candidatus Sulfopaludibacter sp. SbA4]|nr:hypothetical protein SBA4_3340005 [Candidatus Sulfopaludibacter sp. SbA4]
MAIYRDNLLPATVDGYGITDPFRAALIRNQLGPDLEGEWFAMLRGESSRLGGTRMSGLRGVLAMPQSSATLGRPWTSQIARALGEMARYLEKFPDKRQQFRLLVSDAQKPFGSTLHHYDLIAGAIESNWPVWAVEANCLYVKAPGATARHMRAYLWKYIAECIPESYPSQRLNSYFDGAFFEMELSAEALEYVDEIAPLFEENLLGNPFSSVGAMTCVVAKVTDQLERRMRSKGKRLAAKAILSARERVLGQVYSATVILHPKKSWTPQKGIDQFKAGRWETQDLSGVHGWIEELRAR